jgi:gluconolactonase
VNGVIVHPLDHSIWFADPHYGYHQGIRPKPSLPDQVYPFDASTNSICAIADGFTRPNGLCFSLDLKTGY